MLLDALLKPHHVIWLTFMHVDSCVIVSLWHQVEAGVSMINFIELLHAYLMIYLADNKPPQSLHLVTLLLRQSRFLQQAI